MVERPAMQHADSQRMLGEASCVHFTHTRGHGDSALVVSHSGAVTATASRGGSGVWASVSVSVRVRVRVREVEGEMSIHQIYRI